MVLEKCTDKVPTPILQVAVSPFKAKFSRCNLSLLILKYN